MNTIGFTNFEYIRKSTNLSDAVSDKYVCVAVKEAQEIQLKQIMGEELYNHFVELIGTGDIWDTDYEYELLENEIQSFLAYQTIANLSVILSFKYSNIGVNRTFDTNVDTLGFDDVIKMRNIYQEKADWFGQRIQDNINRNKDYYKEWLKIVPDTVKPNLNASDFHNPIWCGGKRGK